jgi:putative endonuclease
MKQHNYYVYILTNFKKTALYTGVTNNLERRLMEHIEGHSKFAFTGKYKCSNLIYYEHYTYIDRAIAREKEIKGWSRKKKEDLIATENPNWDFLNSIILE